MSDKGQEYRGENTSSSALRTRTAARRCGGSANKPYCDGSHNKAGFAAEVG